MNMQTARGLCVMWGLHCAINTLNNLNIGHEHDALIAFDSMSKEATVSATHGPPDI